ncbi:MAG: 2,3-bisphosphoglycerate-independent phosphoglycerate mutase [Nitrospiraceae bacterium]
MKYLILHGERMAGTPHPDLGGKTPLQAANTPRMDELARKGELGLISILPEGLAPGGTVRQLAIFGYDLRKCPGGPAPYEAASQGVALGDLDVAFRCSMVTLRAGASKGKGAGDEIKKLAPQVVLDDAAAGGIGIEEARELLESINEQLGSETIQFYPGSDHRHLLVWVGGKARATTHDPRAAVGQPIGAFLPAGDGADILKQVMEASLLILRDHPVNDQRREAGQKPANCLWLWGQGRAARLPKLTDKYQKTGSVVSARELLRGIGICAGFEAVNPLLSGQGGERGPDFEGLASAAQRELAKKDFVYVHVKLPGEVAHSADAKAKVSLVEAFDKKTVGPILDGLAKLGPHRVALICDHGVAERGQASLLPAPYVLYDGTGAKGLATGGFSEADAEAASGGVKPASRLMSWLFTKG